MSNTQRDAKKLLSPPWKFTVRRSINKGENIVCEIASNKSHIFFKPLDAVQVKIIAQNAKTPYRWSKISLHKKFKLILEQNVRNQTYLEMTFWTQTIIFRIQNCEKMGVDPNSCFQVVKVIAKGQNWLFLKVHFAWIQMCKQAKMSNVCQVDVCDLFTTRATIV